MGSMSQYLCLGIMSLNDLHVICRHFTYFNCSVFLFLNYFFVYFLFLSAKDWVTECIVNFIISHSKQASLHVVPDDTFDVCVLNN